MSVKNPKYITVWLGLISLLYIINVIINTSLSLIQTLVIGFVYGVYYYGWLYVLNQYYHRAFRSGNITLAAMVIFSWPYVYGVVYYMLPAIGEQVHHPEVPFSNVQFFMRIVSGLITSFFIAALAYYFIDILPKQMEVKKSQQALQKTLLKVKKRLKQFEGRKGLSIHFLRNLSIILGAKNKIYKAADAKIVMEHLTELINYVFEHQGDDARLVHWREEFAQVKALRFILESIEGDQVLNIVDFDRAFNSMVVPFSFLTIIENAYLHGYKGTKEPIEVTLEKNEHSLRFKCVNSMNPSYIFKHRQETGLASLDQLLLKAHGVHYKLDTIKEDNQYYVMLEVNDPV